ncbi:type II toxin-antitoxin system RelE family toxin [Methanosarcina barkeri]|uniref:type II toxin-antitoxin system RelE family toxin n=1 Tax=Methanosarcina barkeri TaxID=2208 RepID=UPI0006985AC6|nr:type II toxin-antitoxin system RelE/ParE family toxin [Methanosarcina barkeri]
MYTVQYTSRAIKDINKLPPEVRKRIFDAIHGIKEEPYSHVKKLKTSPDSPIYSLRVGEYRVLLNITRSQLIIFVIGAGNRSTIYRKL